MANSTDPFAEAVHGTNPQNLIEKITRLKIYNCNYWKEHCFGLTAETIVDKAIALKYCGGTYAGNVKPTPFLCLALKLLQLQPEKEIVIEFIKNEDFKYLRVLGAFYFRLVGKAEEVYKYLEPLYNDYRKLAYRGMSGWKIIHIDEFVDDLLYKELVCDVALPHLLRRTQLEDAGVLKPRVSALEDGMNLDDDDDENDEEINVQSKLKSEKRDANTAAVENVLASVASASGESSAHVNSTGNAPPDKDRDEDSIPKREENDLGMREQRERNSEDRVKESHHRRDREIGGRSGRNTEKEKEGGAGREKEAGQIKDVDILALGHTRDPDPLHIAVGTGAEAGEVTIVAMTEVEVQVVVAIVEVGIVLQEEAENDPREEEVESVTLEEVEIVRREEVIVVAGRTPHHLLIQVRRLHHGLPRRDGGVGHHNDTGPPSPKEYQNNPVNTSSEPLSQKVPSDDEDLPEVEPSTNKLSTKKFDKIFGKKKSDKKSKKDVNAHGGITAPEGSVEYWNQMRESLGMKKLK
eukprot:CAMPEP_0185036274 /NCGR_PEP_ID=MMETSP1103-20130426/29004_1 /TAXON_ID=36769 /ORGANISM="Paraphysomonas bandaiensis, Strain Caron Lab Isolate" /LENGTH=520 /DNA_ID=CAMNT_0027573759 /DNA_START=77 /DNA_END=1639 /DNA_ORIENTATION=+